MKKQKQLINKINKLQAQKENIDERLKSSLAELKEIKKQEIITICHSYKITINDLKIMLKNKQYMEENNIDYENNEN